MTSNNNFQGKKVFWLVLLILIVAGSLLLSGCGAEQPKVYRVGVLSGLGYFIPTVDGFKAKMTELGYVEDQNIVYDVQKTDVDMAAYQSILQKFVADEVDLIFVFPTEASLVAKATTQETNIPVIFAHALLDGSDLVNSIREPGGNITGVRFPGPDMAAKRLEIFHRLAPQAKRMLIPYQQGYPGVPSQLEVLRLTAEAAGITLVELPVNNPGELEADLQARMKSDDIGFEAVLCIVEPVATMPDALAVLSKFSAESKVPFGGCPMMPDSYTSVFETRLDNVAVGEQAAILADKTFKGTAAGTIPVISPEAHLGLNYKVAQELGLTVPDGLLNQAVQVIQ